MRWQDEVSRQCYGRSIDPSTCSLFAVSNVGASQDGSPTLFASLRTESREMVAASIVLHAYIHVFVDIDDAAHGIPAPVRQSSAPPSAK